MPLYDGIEVEGLRDLDRGLHELSRDVQVGLRTGLRHAAEPARHRIEELAATKIRGMARQRTVDWSQMRIGGGTTLVYVAPLQKGRRSKRNPFVRRPNLAVLLMTKAMEPGLHETEGQIRMTVEHEVDQAIRKAGF